MPGIETKNPPGTPQPIGPYSHVTTGAGLIFLSATSGVNPATGQLAGTSIEEQVLQVLNNLETMLHSAASDLRHVLQVVVYLLDMGDFEKMNGVYAKKMGEHRPSRTVIGVRELPKPGVRVTMSMIAAPKS